MIKMCTSEIKSIRNPIFNLISHTPTIVIIYFLHILAYSKLLLILNYLLSWSSMFAYPKYDIWLQISKKCVYAGTQRYTDDSVVPKHWWTFSILDLSGLNKSDKPREGCESHINLKHLMIRVIVNLMTKCWALAM